jgi:hypothetical protein
MTQVNAVFQVFVKNIASAERLVLFPQGARDFPLFSKHPKRL